MNKHSKEMNLTERIKQIKKVEKDKEYRRARTWLSSVSETAEGYEEVFQKHGKNCFGTALFLVGLIDEDRYVSVDETTLHLGNYIEQISPKRESLAFFYNQNTSEYKHLAVVLRESRNPRLIHRSSLFGRLRYDKLSTIIFATNFEVKYYGLSRNQD